MNRVIYAGPRPRASLNVRQLFGAIFFEPWTSARHPDMKRQRSRRSLARARAAARALKRAYVPLHEVDRMVWMRVDWQWDTPYPQWRKMEVPR